MNVWCRMKRTWIGLSVVVGLVCMLAAPTWADYQAGVDAYERGDYETALKEWRPLANQGLAVAQNNLGWMYDQGEGVAQDYTEAMKWYRLAEDQGNAAAQNNLGAMYINGEGVRRNYVQAYMWLSLAAKQGYKRAVSSQGQLEMEMTPGELAEAERLARGWTPKGE